jgi:hypothetical protein
MNHALGGVLAGRALWPGSLAHQGFGPATPEVCGLLLSVALALLASALFCSWAWCLVSQGEGEIDNSLPSKVGIYIVRGKSRVI